MALLAVIAASMLTACDPCAGVMSCRGNERISVGGQIVARSTGRAVSGVRVEVVPTSGAQFVERSSVSAVTDAHGYWQVSAPATTIGMLDADFVITPPAPLRPYRVTGIHLRTTSLHGDGNLTNRWVADPYLTFLGEIKDRDGAPIPGAVVRFVRRGGVRVHPDVVEMITDGSGRFLLDVAPEEYGMVDAEFIVSPPGAASATTIPYPIRTMHLDAQPYVMAIFNVGPTAHATATTGSGP